MSHYTAIQTEINDVDCLKKALEAMGFMGKVEVYETAQPLYGYRGDVRAQKAHVIVRRKYVGAQSNDIGFERQPDGTYKAHISEYDRNSLRYNEEWIGRVKQNYTAEKITKEARRQGYSITKAKAENGKLRMVLVKA